MRIVLQGGDNMLGRAVQLTLPYQTLGDDKITDTLSAQEYLNMIQLDMPLEEIRKLNIDGSYLWGDLLNFDFNEDVRILNLESAPTLSIHNQDRPNKSIHYHVNLNNLPLLFSHFKYPHILSMANNHSLDMGLTALVNETLPNIKNIVGIGINNKAAYSPIIINNIAIFAFGAGCSEVPSNWEATSNRAGIAYLPPIINENNVEIAFNIIKSIVNNINKCVVISIHWGPNWASPDDGQKYRELLGHRLIDELKVSLIYGHSSHHIRGLELYKGHLILYGAGDFINDYENIHNPEELKYNTGSAIFIVDLNDITYEMTQLQIIPFKIEKLRCLIITNIIEINEFISFINKQSITDSNYPIILEKIG